MDDFIRLTNPKVHNRVGARACEDIVTCYDEMFLAVDNIECFWKKDKEYYLSATMLFYIRDCYEGTVNYVPRRVDVEISREDYESAKERLFYPKMASV